MIAMYGKYVRMEGNEIVMIPANGSSLCHRDIACVGTPVSAGFFTASVHNGVIAIRTFGRSDTLDLESKPDDAAVIFSAMKFA